MGIYDNRLIRLDFGEPSFAPPPESKAEAIKYITSTSCHYSPIRGEKELLDKIVTYLEDKYSQSIEKENISVTSGGLMGLNTILKCLKDEGISEVYYPNPGFPPYQFMNKYIGIKLKPYPMINEKEVINFVSNIAKHKDRRTVAFLITSPNNPNGLTLSSDCLNSLTESLANQYIVLDNSFESFVFREVKKNSLAIGENIFHSFSFSKSFSLADFRVGFVITPNSAWCDQVSRSHWFSQLSTSVISQKAAIGALNCKKDYLENNKKIVQENLENSLAILRSRGINVENPEGGFFLWVNIEKTNLSSEGFVQYCLSKYRLSLISGETFGTQGAGYVRINCATDEFTLHEGLERFVKCYLERTSNYENSV